MRKYLAEGIGTFTLVFCGTGAIVVHDVSGGIVGHQGIALTFGAVVAAMIYALGPISGAHINPAVTVGFAFSRQFQIQHVLPYIVAQLVGAVAASLLLRLLFPIHEQLGATLPSGSVMQSFIFETVLTYFLMLVILLVGLSEDKRTASFTGIAVGAMVGLEALFAGPICGASMNPARSFAPALVAQVWTAWWIYWIAPLSGAILATLTWRYLRKETE
ncbi:MAG: aquaporin [Bacteroidota bacterium]